MEREREEYSVPLDAVKAMQESGEADFIRLVSLGLQFSCFFFIRGTILLCGQDFMSKVIFIFSSLFFFN